MKRLLGLTVFFFWWWVGPAGAFPPIVITKNDLILDNEVITKKIAFSTARPSSVRVVSLLQKNGAVEMLSPDGTKGWFEFIINGQLVSANDPYWQFRTHSVRKMAHGGEEIILHFRGKVAPVRELEVVIIQQVFPTSSLIREKITLRARGNVSFTLNQRDGHPHVVFPAYSLRAGEPSRVISEEIRMASWGAELAVVKTTGYDERAEADNRGARNLARNYMYHPKKTEFTVGNGEAVGYKGPILITTDGQRKTGWLIAYEHGSPDDDDEQNYLTIAQSRSTGRIDLAVQVVDGAYAEGERITARHVLSSVWSAFGSFAEPRLTEARLETGEALLHEYLYRWICEQPDSRKPAYYYNTWGMQRASPLPPGEKEPRSILTTAKVLDEIALASELNTQLFVLDDGWQNEFGNWTPHTKRFVNGLKPVFDELTRRNMTFGIWLAPIYVDESTPFYNDHPDLAIVDTQLKPVTGRWEKKAFCLVSDYRKHFIQTCKNLIDQGVTYFKWDGLDKHLCNSPLHHHGDATQTAEARRIRYGYEFPLAVTSALAELKAYRPGVVVEVDVTEPDRSVGLSFLSEGKYFWMNNGASGYGDYSTFRAKSTRTIPNLFHSFMPPVLQTYAAYPHNKDPYMAQRYNVNSAMVGGKGFWGNLNLMTKEQRLLAGKYVRNFQKTDAFLGGIRTQVVGSVGSSPEIYTRVDGAKAAGQVVAFSGAALMYVHSVPLAGRQLLAVTQTAYRVENDTLYLNFNFPMGETTREAFLFPNRGSGISLRSSTSWVSGITLEAARQLTFRVGAPGIHVLHWPIQRGKPAVDSSPQVKVTVKEDTENQVYIVRIETLEADINIKVHTEN